MKSFTLNLLAACGLLYGCNNATTTDSSVADKKSVSNRSDSTSTFITGSAENISTSVPAKEMVEEVKENTPPAVGEPTKQIPLTIVVEKLASADAPIEMSIYTQEDNFPAAKSQAKKYRWKPKKGKAITKVNNLPYGKFAIALYQDVNDNGKIDKNMIGIPEEPFAFSNDYKPVIKAPSFNDCKFSYSPTENTITLTLQN